MEPHSTKDKYSSGDILSNVLGHEWVSSCRHPLSYRKDVSTTLYWIPAVPLFIWRNFLLSPIRWDIFLYIYQSKGSTKVFKSDPRAATIFHIGSGQNKAFTAAQFYFIQTSVCLSWQITRFLTLLCNHVVLTIICRKFDSVKVRMSSDDKSTDVCDT